MRSPLCVAKLFAKDDPHWRVFFSAATARGIRPLMVVYMRPPTEDERKIVEEGILSRNAVFYLDALIQHRLFGDSTVPPVLVSNLPDQLDGLEEDILSDELLDSCDQTTDGNA